MGRIRHRLSWLAAGWLTFQCAMIAAAPVTLSARILAEDCDCPGTEPGQTCPMHQDHSGPADPAQCVMQNACAPSDVALLSLAAGIGVLPKPIAIQIELLPTLVTAVVTIPSDRTELPDAPPPRA